MHYKNTKRHFIWSIQLNINYILLVLNPRNFASINLRGSLSLSALHENFMERKHIQDKKTRFISCRQGAVDPTGHIWLDTAGSGSGFPKTFGSGYGFINQSNLDQV